MLYMSVFTYEPEKRYDVVKKRIEVGLGAQGVKIIGQWSYLGFGKIFTLVDATDPHAIIRLQAPYDMGKFEVFPVIETEKMLDILKEEVKHTPAFAGR